MTCALTLSSGQPGHETESGKESPSLSEPPLPHLSAHCPSPDCNGKCFPREAQAPSTAQCKGLDTGPVPPRTSKSPRSSKALSGSLHHVPLAAGWAPSPAARAAFGDHIRLAPRVCHDTSPPTPGELATRHLCSRRIRGLGRNSRDRQSSCDQHWVLATIFLTQEH